MTVTEPTTDFTVTEPPLYRWTRDEFVRAWEVGAFERRVELVEGEVWEVSIGPWHGETTGQVIRALPGDGVKITMATLPAGDSLPDPDCWVLRAGASPAGTIGRRLASWRPEDVLLVVEVSDESVTQDLGVKALLYGRAGYAVYWVVTSRTRHPPESVAVAEALGAEVVPLGSAGAKAMAVVRGEVDAYVHAGGMYQWDSAAPVAVAAATGLHVSRIDGSPFVYNDPDPYLPDLLICRPELAGACLAALSR